MSAVVDENETIPEGETIAEDNTKRIVKVPRGDDLEHCSRCKKVLVISKDDITAGDGKARESFAGKAKSANTTTSNIFKLLKLMGIPTHFLEWNDDTSFFALQAEIIPLEVVVQRIATGSYLKRNPFTNGGKRFKFLEFELFLKDDKNNDPFVQLKSNENGDWIVGYRADLPMNDRNAYIGSMPILPDRPIGQVDFDEMRIMALQVFQILEQTWAQLEVVLYDLKLEFGLVPDGRDGVRLVVVDVIWCIRGKDGYQLNIDVFRDAAMRGVIKADLEEDINEHYELVAKLSESFCDIGRKMLSAR